MKLWRKLGNKVQVKLDEETLTLTGRQLKYYQQVMKSNIKPASTLMLSLIKRI